MTNKLLILLFLFLNFLGLGIGSRIMGDGPISTWYLSLNKAPWTPPGWVFGAAWTFIMICFSIYLMYFFKDGYKKNKLLLFGILWVLNVSWNYLFFNQQLVLVALISIVLLTLLILFMVFHYFTIFKEKQLLLAPYAIWLVIATSLNAYVYFNN